MANQWVQSSEVQLGLLRTRPTSRLGGMGVAERLAWVAREKNSSSLLWESASVSVFEIPAKYFANSTKLYCKEEKTPHEVHR